MGPAAQEYCSNSHLLESDYVSKNVFMQDDFSTLFYSRRLPDDGPAHNLSFKIRNPKQENSLDISIYIKCLPLKHIRMRAISVIVYNTQSRSIPGKTGIAHSLLPAGYRVAAVSSAFHGRLGCPSRLRTKKSISLRSPHRPPAPCPPPGTTASSKSLPALIRRSATW